MGDSIRLESKRPVAEPFLNLTEEITENDVCLFEHITTTELTAEQQKRLKTPSKVFPRQKSILAVHWHPEFIPMELTSARMAEMFPNSGKKLVIPTQHNELTTYGNYTGVEVDCYSKGFNQKVQLLLHFPNEVLVEAHRLRAMLLHTFKYRSHQLFEYMDTITRPVESRLQMAARDTGTSEELIRFVQTNVRKIQTLLEDRLDKIPPIMVKNKLLRNFFDGMRDTCGDGTIDRVQTFLKSVKERVKAGFSLKYFYRTSEVIEEARSLGGGVVVPHPEQFWPILLKDYDVDGIEVWNPQSRRYTDFLISVLNQRNRKRGAGDKKLITFMGDDTHLGEKVRDPAHQDPEKAGREVGLQPAWDDMGIRKTLIMAGVDREKVIDEYQSRLDG